MDLVEKSISPNQKHNLEFVYAGEIRFGPIYYFLKLNEKTIKEKYFGFDFIWENNSNFLAVQEWKSISQEEGPHTSIAIFDLEKSLYTKVADAKGGFSTPLKFENAILFYKKGYYALPGDKPDKGLIEMSKIKNWKAIKFEL